MFVYKYSQLTDRITYRDALQKGCISEKIKIHLGQLKLLISEIMFLTKKAKDGDRVLYVGAAEGYHTAKLADMFPTLTFDLWDPGRLCPS